MLTHSSAGKNKVLTCAKNVSAAHHFAAKGTLPNVPVMLCAAMQVSAFLYGEEQSFYLCSVVFCSTYIERSARLFSGTL